MFAKHTLFLLVVALVEARFGQEQGNGAVQAISALGDIGQSGQADTLAGESIKFLLAAANPCQKLVHADKIVETLGTDDRVIAAARGFVGAEQNFNPFNVKVPSICAEPDLPKTEALRGVVPLIDPDVEPKDVENANAKTSLDKPFDATGKSVADVMVANGFTNFTAVKLDGTKVDLAGGAASGGKNDNNNAADDKKERRNAAGAAEGQKNVAGAGAGGASGGANDNKNAAGDKKEGENAKAAGDKKEGENAKAAGDKKEGEDAKAAGEKKKGGNAKAAGDKKKGRNAKMQEQIKACSALMSFLNKGNAGGANKKAEGKNQDEKKAGGANDTKAAGANDTKAGGANDKAGGANDNKAAGANDKNAGDANKKAGDKNEDEKKGAGAAKA